MLPWFTDPELRVAFFRPLSSLSHRLDLALWPGLPAADVRAQPAMVRRARWVPPGGSIGGSKPARSWPDLRRCSTPFDHVHGPAVAWLSNRNALIATFFGVLALIAARPRAQPGFARRTLARPRTLRRSGLLSGEFAIGAMAYLFAYALSSRNKRPARRPVVALAVPVVIGLWQIGYKLEASVFTAPACTSIRCAIPALSLRVSDAPARAVCRRNRLLALGRADPGAACRRAADRLLAAISCSRRPRS